MMTVPSKMSQYLDNRVAVRRSDRNHKYALSVTLITSLALSMIAYGLTHGGPIHLTGPMRDFAVVLPGLLATSTGAGAILAYYTKTIEKKRAKCGHQGLLRAIVENEALNKSNLNKFIETINEKPSVLELLEKLNIDVDIKNDRFKAFALQRNPTYKRFNSFLEKMDTNEAKRFIAYVRHHYFHKNGSLAKAEAKQAIETFINLNKELKGIYEKSKDKPSASHLDLADVTKAYSNELRNKQIHVLLATFGLFVALGAIGVACYAAATHPSFMGEAMTLSQKSVVIASGGYGAISLLAFISIGSFLMTRKKYAAFNKHENLLEALNNDKKKQSFTRPAGNPLNNESYEAILGHLYQQVEREDLEHSLNNYEQALTKLASFNLIEFITYFKTYELRKEDDKEVVEQVIKKQLHSFIDRALLFATPIVTLRTLVEPLEKKTGIELDLNPMVERAIKEKLRGAFEAITKKESTFSKMLEKIDSTAEEAKLVHESIFENLTQPLNLRSKNDAVQEALKVSLTRLGKEKTVANFFKKEKEILEIARTKEIDISTIGDVQEKLLIEIAKKELRSAMQDLNSEKVNTVLDAVNHRQGNTNELDQYIEELTGKLIDRLAEEKDAFNFKERINDIDAFRTKIGKPALERGVRIHRAGLQFLKKQWEQPIKKVDLESLEKLQKEKTELFKTLKVKVGLKAKFRAFAIECLSDLNEEQTQAVKDIIEPSVA